MPAEAAAGPPRPKAPPVRRVDCPSVLQMEAVECGAAALAMVLAHHGRIVPLEVLRVECGVSRDGSKASNMLKAARRYGLVAKGFKGDVEDLYDIALPCILFWNMNHFVVLEGFGKKGKVYLKDPGEGPRTVTLNEMDESFSGVVLTFQPGEGFEKGGEKPSMAAALRSRLVGSESALLFTILCGLALVVPGLVVPTFSRVFVDEVLVAGRDSLVRPLLVGMAITAVVKGILTWLQSAYLLRLETKLALRTSSDFFSHVLRLPISYFTQRYGGEIGSRVLINDKVAQMMSGRLARTTLDCVLVVFYVVLMLLYDVWLTLLVVAIAALNVAALRFAARTRVDASRRLAHDYGSQMGTAMSGLRMIETLKATGGESEFFGRWAGYQAKTLRSHQALGLLGAAVSGVPALVTTLMTTVVLLVGSLKVMNGGMTVGMLVAYQSLMASFAEPLHSLVSFGEQIQELEADMYRLDDVLRHPQDPVYGAAAAAPATGTVKLAGAVELRNVTFGYSPLEEPLIRNFNLVVKPGQRVALVGASGSGKSTVSKLVAGLYEPWEGEVLFDGVPRKELPRGLLTNSIGLVDQEVFLFGGTLRDNLTMWDATVPMPAVVQASKDAEIADVIEAREGTYAAEVEEGGGNWSGGQRQRFEIARALALGPTILVLDEATSALDPSTEARIDDALRRRGCTCVIIAHRLSTIRDADEIVVLERGAVVQRGTHDEMKGQPGAYADLIAAH